MPPDSGIAFIVVTHMDPHATSYLPELLSRVTRMPVREAIDGQVLAENIVIVMPPGKSLALEHGILRVRDAIMTPHGVALPIDAFFRSLAEDQQEKAIGIILSGTGTDGTLGAKAIKNVSGMMMVQDAESARFPGMPQSAVATGLVDYVLSPEQMPAELLAYVRGPYLTRSAAAPAALAVPPEVLQEILSLIQTHTGHSFAAYKISTIHRRIERRLTLHQMTQPDHYLRYLREHPEEIDTLFQELLIGVTSFFRDPEAFTVLTSTVLPVLLANKMDGEAVRVWVAGCSTGEEAYSLAIVLHECLGQLRKPCAVQIFATDLDAQAIDIARRGLYPEGIAADVTPERLQRYFTHADAVYRICKELRDMMIFATHNLLTDPPFTHMDLLSCRNLLIYLDTDAQHHLLSLFHYALRTGGVLFLGTSETIGNLGDLFTTLNGQWKLFARNDEVSFPYPLPEHVVVPFSSATRPPYSPGEPAQLGTLLNRATAYLAQRFAPPSVLITTQGDIVHFHGRTGAYLEPPRGQPSLNIFSMAREGLDRVLMPAIRAALAQEAPIIRSGVGIKANGETILTDVFIEQVPESGPLQGLLLVTFRPAAVDTALAVAPGRHAAPHRGRRRMVDLEQELQETRETLHSTIEEREVTNEKLASANEELQSTNEEMQSANEELKTSREELQSLNEELQTVNAELLGKVDELSHANDDMTNLLNSTDIATIFLDDTLQIKRFTTQATRLMALIPSDVGRPLSDLTLNLDYATLLNDAKEVLRTLVAREKEVRTKNGVWYLVRILSYRTSENVIDGLVIIFINIDNIKRAEAGQQQAVEQLEAGIVGRQRADEQVRWLSQAFMQAAVPLIVEDTNGSIVGLNAAAERLYGWTREELLGQSMHTLVPAASHAQVDSFLARCRQGTGLDNVESFHQTKTGEVIPVRLTVFPLTNEHSELLGLVTIATHLPH
jgi:two-component system, chemotaxis family, CheB/CheR fusion protein